MACKRPTPDGDACSATAAVALSPCNKPRWLFMSIFNYKRMETLGAGTYIVVYRLADVERDCLAACRGHPYVVQLRDVAANPSNRDMFLVKEFVGARSLRDLIAGHARRRPFSEGETRALMRQLRAGVRTMHAAGIAHRDIKPRNILIGPGGALKICDFGMATTAAPPYEGFMVGTLHYNTPEQLAGNRCYGPAVDMWALGCIMGELLTGAPLFGGDMIEEELLADLSDNLGDPLRELFEDVLLELSPANLSGLLSFDPEKRLTAAEAMEHRWFAQVTKRAEFTGFDLDSQFGDTSSRAFSASNQ
ncbi:putative cyclin-dependent kinase F-2 [Oryza sativa Japonica Group]|uniref:putative cyclin-dependent kinase F-2 n=1 Tax=Oryza sativa subsp. japonica TaxID=39947 RepID=UPI0007754791|nr:putative cyclin-dependent kinase F-2 [Oryza sativa Japonica Group]